MQDYKSVDTRPSNILASELVEQPVPQRSSVNIRLISVALLIGMFMVPFGPLIMTIIWLSIMKQYAFTSLHKSLFVIFCGIVPVLVFIPLVLLTLSLSPLGGTEPKSTLDIIYAVLIITLSLLALVPYLLSLLRPIPKQ